MDITANIASVAGPQALWFLFMLAVVVAVSVGVMINYHWANYRPQSLKSHPFVTIFWVVLVILLLIALGSLLLHTAAT